MKSTLSIPNITPENIEATIAQLRQMTNNVKSWSWVNGTLHVIIQDRPLLIRGKTITTMTYHDEKSWVAKYERDEAVGRWVLTMSRGDWDEKLEGQ